MDNPQDLCRYLFILPLIELKIKFDYLSTPFYIYLHQYHYEVVMGVSGNNFLAKTINKLLTKELSTDFFEAWHLHNTIEVGTFENFLPALYEQREIGNYSYLKSMNSHKVSDNNQTGFSKDLFEVRFNGYKNASNPFSYQAYEKGSFL